MASWPDWGKLWPDEWHKDVLQIEKMKKVQLLEMQKVMSTPEAKIKQKVKKVLENVNAYYIMPNTGGFGASGAPDFIVCLRGKFVGIECKAGKGKTSLLQDKNLKQIASHGGTSMIVDDSTDMTELQLKLIYLMEND